LKTDSPVLYQFTKWVADMYRLTILEDSADIHSDSGSADFGSGDPRSAGSGTSVAGTAAGSGRLLKPELAIRTHYESLDIAQSKKVHYLCFTLPAGALPDRDGELLERIKNEEPVPPARVMRPPRIIAPSGQKKGRPAGEPPTAHRETPTTNTDERAD
jgi:tRNA (guanine-N7-)-methyltransferase